MVLKLVRTSQIRELIERNRVVLIAFVDKLNNELWKYVEYLMKKLESRAGYLITFAMAHIDDVRDFLRDEEVEIARKRVLIKMFVDGDCVFEQEGLFGHIESDVQALKRGIKDVLKRRSFKTLF